jgi:2-C-methyl-D-erythritol 4-phosphate cytidylyltransferase
MSSLSNNRFALIVAGGSGTRMCAETPKQFLLLNSLPILMHTISAFNILECKPRILVVLPEHHIDFWNQLCIRHAFNVQHTLVKGGETRFHSVKNGLNAIDGDGLVAIHDGVRPIVSQNLIERCFNVASEKGNALPAVKPNETVRLGTPEISKKINRDECWLVQTPQVFEVSKIKSYYMIAYNETFTDDASVAEANGCKIQMVEGERENIKITTPIDLAYASQVLKTKAEGSGLNP